MRIARNLRLSLAALGVHRLRTALAIAGTATGVAGVLVLTAIGNGARAGVLRQIDALGGALLVITRTPADAGARLARQGRATGHPLSLEDAAAVHLHATGVLRAAPGVDRRMVARSGPIRNAVTVLGTTPDWQVIRRFRLVEGRFFSRSEGENGMRVAVLGAGARAALFPDTATAVGRSIRIGTAPFEVIGVLEPKGTSAAGGTTEDDRIVVPVETAMRRLFSTRYIGAIFIEATSPDSMAGAAASALAVLRARRPGPAMAESDFVVDNQRVLLDARLQTQTSFQRLLFALALLSLLVGTVGILAVLVLSVRERRAEIGLRVAVGGRTSDLLLQFFAEALLLAVAGGAAGVPLGLTAAAATEATTRLHARVDSSTIAVAVVAALVAGLCSGVLPAWRAATLDPVDALGAG